jgi:hypothetical protein
MVDVAGSIWSPPQQARERGLGIVYGWPTVDCKWADSAGHAAGSHSSGPTMNPSGGLTGDVPPSDTAKGAGQRHNQPVCRGLRPSPRGTSWTQKLRGLCPGGARKRGALGVLAENAGRRGESWFFRIDLPCGLDGKRHQDRVNGFATEREAGRVPCEAKVDIDAAWPVTLALERLGGFMEISRPVARFVAGLSFWAAHSRRSRKVNEISPPRTARNTKRRLPGP